MLIPFPFAFLTGGWGFRLAAAMSGNDELKTVSRHLVPAGLVAGLIAAVPGLVDYLGSVPPQSSAKERATRHALFNVTALALFAAGWLAGRRRDGVLPLTFQSIGTATLCVGGGWGEHSPIETKSASITGMRTPANGTRNMSIRKRRWKTPRTISR